MKEETMKVDYYLEGSFRRCLDMYYGYGARKVIYIYI